ncbi:MAG: xanthine dehydrogenase family protein [Rhodospirillales bacterium]|nr:xanthine dehydrogenase family protein [Rhodospirillales bacterium]
MQRNAIGQGLRRREDGRLLTGGGHFLADVVPAGAAWAEIVRSPHAHADILGIDAEGARRLPGVLAVLTGADLAAAGIGGVPADDKLIHLPGTPDDVAFAFRPSFPALAAGRARYAGEAVAMIVAETPAAAAAAAERVEVAYRERGAVVATAKAIGGPTVWDEAADNVCFRWQAGDAAAASAAIGAARHVVRLRVRNNRVHVGALETRGAIGRFADGRYHLATGSQMPHGLRDALARVLGVERAAVHVSIADVGGSFGIRNALCPEQILVLFAARLLGRPVAWIGSRADGFLSDYQARDNVADVELALDEALRFTALRVRTLAAIGAHLAPKGALSPTANTPALAGVYALPAIHVEVTGVFTNTAPTEVYRGAGRPEAVHLLERVVDHAARELGVDRLDLRRRNLITPAALPYSTRLGLLYDSGDFPATLADALAAHRPPPPRPGWLRGLGIAHYCERVAVLGEENAWLELQPDGRVTLLIGTMSNGQGHVTAYAQLLADRLGIDAGMIEVVQGDTDRIPSGGGTGGSSSLAIGGQAAALSAAELIGRLTERAGEALEAAAADIAYADGVFRVAGTDLAISWEALARRLPAPLVTRGSWKPSGPSFPNGCHLASVDVDPQTGAWRLVGYTMVHDFGTVINPLLLEGQLQGGVAQGFGQAAMEQVVHDEESGQPLTGSWMDYAMPRADDLPALALISRPTPSPLNPLGIKGAGEAGAAGAPPAVMNALLDALAPLGVRDLDMPATPFAVWRAIGAAGG